MCHVTIVELIKLKILLECLFIDIIQYKKYKIIDISQFSFFSQNLGPNMGLNDPHPLLKGPYLIICAKMSKLCNRNLAYYRGGAAFIGTI